MPKVNRTWDAFISYASEDKQFVSLLAHRLREAGLEIWYDDFALSVGDSLRKSIDQGLAHSKFGIVILSPSFFRKEWPQRELAGLVAKENEGQKVILPVWHDITAVDIPKYSPLLADRLAITSNMSLEQVALELIEAICSERFKSVAWTPHEMEWPDGSTMVVLPLRPIGRTAMCIGKHPITNAQYQRYLDNSANHEKSRVKVLKEPVGQHCYLEDKDCHWSGPFYPWREKEFSAQNKPVVCVSYADALRYCHWVDSLFLLRLQERPYTMLPNPRLWDFAAFGKEFPTRDPRGWLGQSKVIHHCASAPAFVDSSSARINMRGISDMFGNVWEWCLGLSSYFIPLIGRSEWSPGPDAELRGGSFLDDLTKVEPFFQVSRLRDGLNTKHSDLGFRLSAMVSASELPGVVQQHLSVCECDTAPFHLRDHWDVRGSVFSD